MKFKFIDLFCGVGGFHQGMNALGGKCVFAIDIDKDCREVYKENYQIDPWIDEDIEGNIRWFTEKEHRMEQIPDHDVLCAGFPCQSFSKAGKRGGLEQTEGTLFYDLGKIIEHKKPKHIFLENVPNLKTHDSGNTFKVISRELTRMGYIFETGIVSPHHLGTPQLRNRFFILGSRDQESLPGKIPELKPKKCRIQTILEKETPGKKEYFEKYKIEKTEKKRDAIDMWNEFIKIDFSFGSFRKKPKYGLPGFPIWLSVFETKTSKNLPGWKKTFIEKNQLFYNENKKEIDKWLKKWKPLEKQPESLCKFEWQAQDSRKDLSEVILQFRPSGLRVKKGDYFPTLVAITQTSIIGSRMRRITPREAARLQDFPESFQIHEKDTAAYRQFGNAVNCKVIEYLGKILISKENLFN